MLLAAGLASLAQSGAWGALWLLIGMIAAGMVNRDLQSRRIDSLY